ncbi:hypothetical protein CAPTEDRAFT_215869 [Capitella teleta]|uniref:CARD domain-containing protein n=1 Tax=Capitella teleta TaxID=283909 RepID=R7U5R4_CAPTE|nr:hypothetical protein CAPTEDRAFT_215869 [Capitella teleta]|eukprot:ELU01319.1 hypothetical protein CAPTEDRAFT_215869 [Capitella teleta]
MEDRHKECLVKNRVFMCSEISLSTGLFANLTESGVITDDQLQKLQNIERNDTTKAAVLYFLTELLPKRGSKAFDLFLKALCESEQRHVAERLNKWLSDDCSEDAGTFERLQDELRTHYNDKLQFVYTMPWLPTEGFSLKETFVQRRLRLTSGDRKGTEVKMDEILASLAFAWSQPDEASENIKSFDLVILLHAGDLRGQDSVGGAIKEHLLPIDWDIPSRQLEKLLQEKNVLLIIDAFDEASKKNEIIHQLIEGKRLKHKPLLITSRPNFLENKQRHFESTFTVEGYDEEEQLKHVERYAKHQNIASAPFESMLEEESIIDLCSNPLNLTLLCLLREEDTQLRITRTALYTEIHRIIRRKAGERMDLTEAEVEESLLRPLYQFAFEAYQRNETVVREKDSKKVENFQRICQVGYLTNEVIISRLQKEVRFQFTHKTFVEFLTAKHIAEMDQEERLNWMQHLRYADYHIRIHGLAIDDDFNVEQNEAILGFIFGLLEEESAELTQMASLVIKETRFSSEPHHPLSLFVSPCDASHHQLLRLLAELNVVPQELADVICKRRPPLINIHDDCSVSCRRGMLKLCNLRFQPPIPMNVNLSYSLDEEEKMSFVQKLIKSESIDCSKIWIKPRDHTELWNDVRGWRIGQADSIQQVSIHCYRIEGNPCEKFSFGNHLSELELIHYEPSHSFLLEAALHKPLTSLQLICCHELDDRCISLIRQLLRNQRNLQRVQLTSFPWQQRFGFFLADFAQMENLQSLEIELIDSTDEEMRSLEAILKRNKLSELTIDSYYSGSLESVLNEGFHSMSSLRELHLRRVNIIHLPNLRHLDLINFSLLPPFIFSLRHSTLNDDGIAVLSDALRSWRNLQQLRIHFDEDEDVSVAECSLRKLFEAIAGCHRLQILYFDRLEMADSVVPSVCKMIESLKQLREFTSKDQRDESLTEEGFKQLEPIIKRNGLNTEFDRLSNKAGSEIISEYLGWNNVIPRAVVMVSNEQAKFNSFKLQVKSSDVSRILREDLWPEGVCIRQCYNRNKNKNMNNDITVHDNNGIDEAENTTRKTLYYNYGWYKYI